MRTLYPSFAGLALCAAIGCGPAHHAQPPLTADGTRVFTARDIALMQVSTAWDVVERSGMMDLSEAVDGRSASIKRRRGQNSIILAAADMPLLIVNGVRTNDARVLQGISAQSIARLSVVSGIEATVRQGTDAGSGIIDIVTKSSPDSI